MKKNLRPGYLAGFQGLVSRATRANQRPRIFSNLSGFGKGSFQPMPDAPPGGVTVENAINTSTGQPYVQDTRCPEGDKMGPPKQVPCEGDCDPGEMEEEPGECEDDPAYQLKPPTAAPAQQEQPQQQQQQSQQPQQTQQISQPSPQSTGPTAAQEAELAALTAQVAATNSMVTSAPAMAPPSAYTGSPPPSYAPPLARASKAPDDQQRLMELVSQYKTERPSAPRPRPAARAISRPEASPAASSDILSWLKTSLFGSTDGLGSWSDNRVVKYGVPLVALLAIGLFISRTRK